MKTIVLIMMSVILMAGAVSAFEIPKENSFGHGGFGDTDWSDNWRMAEQSGLFYNATFIDGEWVSGIQFGGYTFSIYNYTENGGAYFIKAVLKENNTVRWEVYLQSHIYTNVSFTKEHVFVFYNFRSPLQNTTIVIMTTKYPTIHIVTNISVNMMIDFGVTGDIAGIYHKGYANLVMVNRINGERDAYGIYGEVFQIESNLTYGHILVGEGNHIVIHNFRGFGRLANINVVKDMIGEVYIVLNRNSAYYEYMLNETEINITHVESHKIVMKIESNMTGGYLHLVVNKDMWLEKFRTGIVVKIDGSIIKDYSMSEIMSGMAVGNYYNITYTQNTVEILIHISHFSTHEITFEEKETNIESILSNGDLLFIGSLLAIVIIIALLVIYENKRRKIKGSNYYYKEIEI